MRNEFTGHKKHIFEKWKGLLVLCMTQSRSRHICIFIAIIDSVSGVGTDVFPKSALSNQHKKENKIRQGREMKWRYEVNFCTKCFVSCVLEFPLIILLTFCN